MTLADAKHGYSTVGDNPHTLWSTPDCIAFAVGRWLKKNGHPAPKSIEPGRGYSMDPSTAITGGDVARWRGKPAVTFSDDTPY